MRQRYFFKNFFTILLLSLGGTLISAVAFGLGLYALVQRGERLVAEPHVHRADRLLGRRQHLRPLCHPSERTHA